MTDKTFQAYADVVNVRDYGAVGSGLVDDATAIQAACDAAFKTAGTPHGGNVDIGPSGALTNKAVYLPAGYYATSVPIVLTGVSGGLIYGAGSNSTMVYNTAGGTVFRTNGFQYCRVSDMRLKGSGSATLFDLDWDGSATYAVALQANTFSNMFFDSGAYGVRIAHSNAANVAGGGSGVMGSENIFIRCHFQTQSGAGITTEGANAIQNQVFGGQCQGCTVGFLTSSGSFAVISGVGFQQNGWDVRLIGNASDHCVIQGCRSETLNFIFNEGGQWITAQSNCHSAGSRPPDGGATSDECYFLRQKGGQAVLLANRTTHSKIALEQWATVDLDNCSFGRTDWYTLGTGDDGLENWAGNTNANGMFGTLTWRNVFSGGQDQPGNFQRIWRKGYVTARTDDASEYVRTEELEGTAFNDASVTWGGSANPQVTFTIGSPGIVNVTNHGHWPGQSIRFFTDNVLPALVGGGNLSSSQIYYVLSRTVNGNTSHGYTIGTSPGGSPLGFTSEGVGGHYQVIPRYHVKGDQVKNIDVSAGGSPGWVCTTSGYPSGYGGSAVWKTLPNVAS